MLLEEDFFHLVHCNFLPAAVGRRSSWGTHKFYKFKKRYVDHFRQHYILDSEPSWRLVRSDGTSAVNHQAVFETFLDPGRPDLIVQGHSGRHGDVGVGGGVQQDPV